MSRLDPEVAVQVLDDDQVWRDAWAYWRQRLDDGGWYHVRVYWPPMYERLLFVPAGRLRRRPGSAESD